MARQRLGVGFVGSGFNAHFHMLSWRGVRDGDILGVWSPTAGHARSAAAFARSCDLGDCRPYRSIAAMVQDRRIDAVWVCGPNFARIENFEEITDTIVRGKGELRGIACEKPLARNVAEAIQAVELARRAGVATGYLENQLFSPHVERGKELIWARGAALTGRPYLARAAKEHSGPHSPWFWSGRKQGGGVLNDMMCHSALVVRHLLTKPGESLRTVKPVRVTSHIASLKWTRPAYARKLAATMKGADYRKALPDLERYYAAIHEVSATPFDVPKTAELELEWWIVHRQRSRHGPGDLERALAVAAAALYRVPPEAMTVYARERTEAMVIRDTKAASGGVSNADWARIERHLRASWRALHAAVRPAGGQARG